MMINVPSLPCPCCGRPVARQSVSEVLRDIRLPPAQRRLLEALARSMGKLISTELLIDVAYGDDPDGGPMDAANCLASHVKRLKTAIEPYGLTINTPRGNKSGRRLVWAQNEGATPA